MDPETARLFSIDQVFCRVQEALGGDTAVVGADTPQVLLLDDEHFLAHGSGPLGGNIAPGTGAYD